MIHITDKKNCCGCSACVQRCPKQCIRLEEDTEGFLYPQVDEETCIKCGLCEKVCPILNQADKLSVLEVLAVKNPNDEERMNSSSGGVFLPLAREVINQGGVVFGAVYDESWEVHHVYAEKIEDVYPMMGSKYLQSKIGNSFKDAERFLKQGREVLFVGSPCQIAGLRTYLRNKQYSNLLAVDFLCHGVPSPGVWRRYLAETYGGYDAKEQSRLQATAGKNSVLLSSLNATSPIGDIKFRDKRESGWKKFRFVVRQKSASKADQNTVLSSDIHYDNPFMRGFLSDIYLRPSCYACKCKNGVNHSDMTIADFWGINQIAPEFDDDKGVGLVLLNTKKGEEYFSRLPMDMMPSNLEKAHYYNGGFNEHTKAHPKRDQFFFLIENGKSIKAAVDICLRLPFKQRVVRVVKKIVKKIVKTILPASSVQVIKKAVKR